MRAYAEKYGEGEDFDQHVASTIAAMQPRAEELGLA